MLIPTPLILAAATLTAAASAPAQQYLLTETFAGGSFPPSGWSLVQNGVSPGWQDGGVASQPQSAFHDDFAGGLAGSNDNLLAAPAVDLSPLSEAWLHFDNRLRWATFLANHPASSGNGASTVEVSTDGGVTWTVAWNETRIHDGLELTSVDLGGWVGQPSVAVGFRYTGDFAHEWTVDRVFLGESPLPPPPPGTPWTVNLPGNFAPVPFFEDFEVAAGVVQNYMAVTAVDPATGQPDPLAWCNIGQMGPMTGTPYSGAWNLEMGLKPGQAGGHYVRNALVLGLDNSGAQYSALKLSLRATDFGEEADAIDGIWISTSGVEWYLLRDWANAGNLGQWAFMGGIDLEAAPVPVSGKFYLMFAQEDNYPYANQDGIGVDDIDVGGTPPPSPLVSTQSACGGQMILDIEGCTHGGLVAVGWSQALGSAAVPAGGCAGTLVDLQNPTKLGVALANSNGSLSWLVQVPQLACGSLYVQLLDVTSCLVSPVLAL